MATRRPGVNRIVTGPGPSGRKVWIKFFDDGSVRFRLDEAGPVTMTKAYLEGSGRNVIIEVMPMDGSPWRPHNIQ